MDDEEYEKLSSLEDLEIIPPEKLLKNKKIIKKATDKRRCYDLLIIFGIVSIYMLLFMTRYYILSPIEIYKNYKNINLHVRGIIYVPIIGTNDIHVF